MRVELWGRIELGAPADSENRHPPHVWKSELRQRAEERYLSASPLGAREFTRAAHAHLSRRIIGTHRIGMPDR